MGTGVHELSRHIDQLREFLERTLTPQLMANLDSTLRAIDTTLKDPNLNANVRAALENFNKLCTPENIANVSEFIKQADRWMQAIKPEDMQKIAENLGTLLEGTTKMIKDIHLLVDKVTGIRSLDDLSSLAETLSWPTISILLGGTGVVLGMSLFKLLRGETSKNEELNKLVALSLQQLYIQTHQLGFMAAEFVAHREEARHKDPQLVYSTVVQKKEQEARMVLETMPPINIETLSYMTLAMEECEKMYKVLYQPALENPAINVYMDKVGSHFPAETFIPFIVNAPGYDYFRVQPARPNLVLNSGNFHGLKKLYGATPIDFLKNACLNKLNEKGGGELLASLKTFMGDTLGVLANIMVLVAQNNVSDLPTVQEFDAVRRLAQYCHETPTTRTESAVDIMREWNALDWSRYNFSSTPQVTDTIVTLILNRAFLEYCYQSAQSLCFPWNAASEVLQGSKDVGRGAKYIANGIGSFLSAPVQGVQNACSMTAVKNGAEHVLNGVLNLKTNAPKHPLRLLTTAACSFGVAKLGGLVIPSKLCVLSAKQTTAIGTGVITILVPNTGRKFSVNAISLSDKAFAELFKILSGSKNLAEFYDRYNLWYQNYAQPSAKKSPLGSHSLFSNSAYELDELNPAATASSSNH